MKCLEYYICGCYVYKKEKKNYMNKRLNFVVFVTLLGTEIQHVSLTVFCDIQRCGIYYMYVLQIIDIRLLSLGS